MTTALRNLLARTLHEAEDGPTCDCASSYREIYTTMADALLALFEVHTEHRVNVINPLVTGTWLGEPFDPAAAIDVLPASWVIGQIERRFVLTTKPEEVADGNR